ncbi:MAG TPA: hypothetical protein PKW66_08975, partial [Polyangiaceae bacterium]|nr:hypothetical protein [Polyangiaceae bacterium]
DGAPVTGFVPVGTTGYSDARLKLPASGNGNHHLEADQRVGITVYGYGQYTSYWYPGGAEPDRTQLNANDIPLASNRTPQQYPRCVRPTDWRDADKTIQTYKRFVEAQATVIELSAIVFTRGHRLRTRSTGVGVFVTHR